MQLIYRLVFVNYLLVLVHGQFTVREDKVLSRRKRYLLFPKGTNMGMSITNIKELMMMPRGFRCSWDAEIAFPLPPGPPSEYINKLKKPHKRQRRAILQQMSGVVELFGLNGSSCVKRLVCEVRKYLPATERHSMFRQLILAVIVDHTSGSNPEKYCSKKIFSQCEISILEVILNSIYR